MSLNVLQKISRGIIKRSFVLSVTTIEWFSNMKPYHQKVSMLREMKVGTLGKEMADCLDKYQLNLIPKYESHDLKHVLLGFEMTPEDEIRLQAFMLGNGNYSPPSLAIFVFGAILLPDLWTTFHADFQKGRNSIPIAHWTIEEYASANLNELKSTLAKPVVLVQNEPNFALKGITKLGAFTAISAGVFGMLFCLPFLFSSNIADLVGAGFPFVGGAVLAVGGLLALSNLSKPNALQQVQPRAVNPI